MLAGLASGTASLAQAFSAKPATDRREPEADGDTLELVQVVFRHGARTPLSKRYWPELVEAWDVCGRMYDPIAMDIKSEDGRSSRPINEHDAAQVSTVFNGGCHKGELTKQGQAQALDYGLWLRQRYVEEFAFLPKEYVGGILGSRTTNYSRTVATLAGVLTGLYPGATESIPVMTTEEMDEILFGNPESCRKLKFMIKKLASENRRVGSAREEDDRIRKALKLGPDKRIHFLDLHDAMTTMQTHGKTIPDGLKDTELLQYIERQATARFMEYVVGPSDTAGGKGEVLRLGMGRLMYLLVERMEKAARKENPGTKMFLYSGHDSTIMPLLAAIGQGVDHWVRFAFSYSLEKFSERLFVISSFLLSCSRPTYRILFSNFGRARLESIMCVFCTIKTPWTQVKYAAAAIGVLFVRCAAKCWVRT